MTGPAGASSPYGPGTPLVRRFLVQLAGLGVVAREQVVALHTAGSHSRAYMAAETALGEAIVRSGRIDARDALAGPLLQLVRGPDAAADTDDELATLDPIAEPALAALLALLVADLLPRDLVALLYAPFKDVIPYSTIDPSSRTV